MLGFDTQERFVEAARAIGPKDTCQSASSIF
jgi:hypothetical protein